ncbi:MAG: DUF4270 family protein [Bacteroidota bacterium]|nr:DUF4270 family protein [Bacteroidota bacterium]
MNKKYLLSIIFVLLLFSIACNDSYNIGENIIPADDFANVYMTDTVTVYMYTDSIYREETGGAEVLMVGKYTDPVFGVSNSSFVTQIMQNDYPNWGDSAVLDSVCISFALTDDYYYGDNEIMPNLSVYELTEIINDQDYYSNENPDDYTSYSLLGTETAIKFTASDSIDSNVVGLRIRLDDAFGQRLIDDSDDFFDSPDYFYEIFRGIYVECNNSPGLFKIRNDIHDDTEYFGLIFYYHFPASPSTTNKYVLPITSSSKHFNLFNHDYSGTPFESEISSPSPAPAQYVYLQAMAGTRVRIEMPGLMNIDNNWLINKAELIINEAPSAVLGDFDHLELLWLVGYNPIKRKVFFEEYYQSSYVGFGIENNQFKLNITRIAQNYMKDVFQNDEVDIYLDLLNTSSDFGRTILTNGINTENPSKLVITYTIID